jgi:hypothetical protein
MTVFGLPADINLGVDTGAGCAAAAQGFNTCVSAPLVSYFAPAPLDSLALRISFTASGSGASGGAFGMGGVQTPEPGTALLLAPVLMALAYGRKRRHGRVLSGGTHGLPDNPQENAC